MKNWDFFYPSKTEQTKQNHHLCRTNVNENAYIAYDVWSFNFVYNLFSVVAVLSLTLTLSLSLSIFLCLSMSHCTLSCPTVSHAKKESCVPNKKKYIFNGYGRAAVDCRLFIFYLCLCVCVEGLSIIIMMKLSMWDVSRKLLPVR